MRDTKYQKAVTFVAIDFRGTHDVAMLAARLTHSVGWGSYDAIVSPIEPSCTPEQGAREIQRRGYRQCR